MIAQFTAKTTNPEKALYFLSLMSCSVNKLKSQMFFKCKNVMFSDFTWKKIYFAPGNGGGGRGGWRPPLAPSFSTAPCFVLLDYQLTESLILAFGFHERIKKNKINIASEFAVIIATFI